jgi:transposase
MARIAVGVHTAKRRHQAAADEPGQASWRGQLAFAVSRAGSEQFVAFLQGLTPEQGDGVVGLEATGRYHLALVEYLTERGYRVILPDPARAAQFRRSQGHPAKPDRLAARALARYLAPQPPSAGLPWAGRPAALRELARFRTDLVRDRSAARNRLRAVLDLAFPELLGSLRLLGKPTVLTLLLRYPTAAAVAAADPDEPPTLVRRTSHAHLGARCVEALSAAARTSVARRQGEAALAVKVQGLARQVLALNAAIADLEQAIEREFARLGYSPRQSPVGTAVSLATLVAEAGNVRRFPSAEQFAAHVGWCPAAARSGRHQRAHPRLARAGNRHIRRLLWMLAVTAGRYPGAYRAYFERRTAQGKSKMHSLVAIGRKLLSAVYAILRTGRPFDPAYVPA